MEPVQEDTHAVHAKTQNVSELGNTVKNGSNHHNPYLEKEEASCSSSGSSDDDSSSEEDLFQLDATELSKPTVEISTVGNCGTAGLPRIEEHSELIILGSNPHCGVAVASNSNSVPNLIDDDDIILFPECQTQPMAAMPSSPDLPVSTSTNGTNISGTLGTTESPPTQVMVRSDVPDPNRIPSSVFSRTKSTAPMEWSVASNESLFSIHMGNSSFSRDNIFLRGRSGELGSPTDPPPPPLSPSSSTPPLENADARKEVLRPSPTEVAADREHNSGEGVRLSCSISQHSDGSNSSFRSFAFPILTGDCTSGSLKVQTPTQKMLQQQQQQQQPQPQPQPQPPSSQSETPKVTPNAAAEKKWFPCLSCCPFCS